MLAGELRDIPGGNCRAIGERLVIVISELRQDFQGVGLDLENVMLSLQMASNGFGVF